MNIIEHNFANCPFNITTPRIAKDAREMHIHASLSIEDCVRDQIILTDISLKSKNGEDLFLSHGSSHIREKISPIKVVLLEEDAAYHYLSGGTIEIKILDSCDKMYIVQFQVNEDLSVQFSHISITEHYNKNLVMQTLRKKECRSTLNK